jgi:hypothetical protein
MTLKNFISSILSCQRRLASRKDALIYSYLLGKSHFYQLDASLRWHDSLYHIDFDSRNIEIFEHRTAFQLTKQIQLASA